MRLLIAACAVLFSLQVLAQDEAPKQGFYIAPHLNNITADGCTIIWESNLEEQGSLNYGLNGKLDQTIKDEAPAKIHRLRLTGLTPETTYSYKVVCGEDTLESTFKTGPAKSRPITFAMIGDSRRWSNRWEATRMWEHVAQWDPEFYITQGDLVPNGHVYDQWPEHFNRFKEINHNLWMATARGNHEGSQIFDPENDWFAQYHELPGDGEPYAAFTWGNTHFVLISFEQTAGSYKWLNEYLPTVDSQYTVLAHHFPVFCTGYYSEDDSRKEMGTSTMQRLARTIFDNDVDLDLSGHTHIYERLHPMKDFKRNDREGTTFVINGGDIGGNFPEQFTAVVGNNRTDEWEAPSYTIFNMNDDSITFKTFCWSKVDEAIIEIDSSIIWKDEALPKAALAKLNAAKGATRIPHINTLGDMRYQAAAQPLLGDLESDNAQVRQAAATALRSIGAESISADLAAYLNDDDLHVRREAARSIEIAMDPALTDTIIAVAADNKQDMETRLACIGALQFYGDAEKTSALLLDLLTQDDLERKVRERAVYALSRTTDESDMDTIIELFMAEKDPYTFLRLAHTMNKLTGRRQSVDGKGPIAKSQPGEERQQFVDKWMDWYNNKKKKPAA